MGGGNGSDVSSAPMCVAPRQTEGWAEQGIDKHGATGETQCHFPGLQCPGIQKPMDQPCEMAK